jgi:hypothetical protein
MKYLLNGVAIAAALAIAAPVWAQKAPMTPHPSAPHAATHAVKPMKKKHHAAALHHRPVRHHMAQRHHMGRSHATAAGNRMTEQLNREELARIQAGGAGAAPPPHMH